jgi:hypothetical protein
MCWVMPPFVDPDDPVQQRRLPVVDVPQERDHRGARLEFRRIVFAFQFGVDLIFQAHRLAELDFDGQFHGQQLGHFGAQLGVDVGARNPHAQQLAEHGPHRNADRFGKLAHGAGQLNHQTRLSRGRSVVGAGPLDARRPARGDHAAFLLVGTAGLTTLCQPLPLQLAMLAPAEGRFLFGRGAFHRRALAGAAPRAFAPRHRRRRWPLRRLGSRRLARAPLLRRRTALLLGLHQVLGQRLLARLAGANRVQRQTDVGLLRRRLGRLLRRRLQRAGRQRRQLDRRPTLRAFGALRAFGLLRFGRPVERRNLVQNPLRPDRPLEALDLLDLFHLLDLLGNRFLDDRLFDHRLWHRNLDRLLGRQWLGFGGWRRRRNFRGRLLLRRRPLDEHRNLARHRRARPQVILAPHHRRRRARRSGRFGRRRAPGRRPRPLARHKVLDDRRFLVSEASQRRALARDTGLGANVGQHLAVELELFG